MPEIPVDGLRGGPAGKANCLEPVHLIRRQGSQIDVPYRFPEKFEAQEILLYGPSGDTGAVFGIVRGEF